jgi:hypothetical protein
VINSAVLNAGQWEVKIDSITNPTTFYRLQRPAGLG